MDQQRDSHYRSFSLAMGAALSRHNLHVRLNDENIETLMYGLYLTRGEQVVDNHTAIYHDQPNCRSWEVYKGMLDGRSRAVFNGKVFVQPEAQKTDAKQTNRNLLLSDTAKVDTKPQLEIFADDVKCTHGATVGRLDDIGAVLHAEPRHPGGGRRAAPDLRLRGGGGRRGGAGAGAARSSTAWCSSAWGADGGDQESVRGGSGLLEPASSAAPGRLFDVDAVRAGLPHPRGRGPRASRWSTSTTPPPARSPRRSSTPSAGIYAPRTPTSTAACTT